LAGEEPDPSLARTTECLMNLREAEQARKNRSKLAEMAEANRSCNGIMSGMDRRKVDKVLYDLSMFGLEKRYRS